eukprot:m.301274 g.301274  ORF g.301274 m.301274 type:complete len:408 (-) comp14701_c0_seq1:232-1455(-)
MLATRTETTLLKVDAIDQAMEHLLGLFRRSLGDLMATTTHSDEGKVVVAVARGISSDLDGRFALHGEVVGPWVPGIGNLVAHAGSPSLVVGVRNADIPVTIVNHNTEVLDESRVRVAGQVGAGGLVSPARLGAACCPVLRRLAHMNGAVDLGAIQIVAGKDTVDARIWALEGRLAKRGLVLVAAAASALLDRAIDAGAINVVDVDVANFIGHLLEQIAAVVRGVGERALRADLLLELGINERRAEEVLGRKLVTLATAHANFRARAAVAHSQALEGGAGVGSIAHCPEDGLGERGHVDTSIALARQEELVVAVLIKLVKKLLERVQVVLGGRVVSAVVVAGIVGIRKAHTNRCLEVEHVGVLVPAVLKRNELGGVGAVQAKGTVFVEEAIERAAARTAVEPEDDGCR